MLITILAKEKTVPVAFLARLRVPVSLCGTAIFRTVKAAGRARIGLPVAICVVRASVGGTVVALATGVRVAGLLFVSGPAWVIPIAGRGGAQRKRREHNARCCGGKFPDMHSSIPLRSLTVW